jgi:orotate phosphoribosyltransferase
LKGEFTLRNGKKSDVYLDIRRAYGYPRMLNMIVDKLNELIDPHTEATCVVGYGFGGMTLANVMASRHGLNLTNIRDEPKTYGTQKQVEGYEPRPSDKKNFKGKRKVFKPTFADFIITPLLDKHLH